VISNFLNVLVVRAPVSVCPNLSIDHEMDFEYIEMGEYQMILLENEVV